MDHSVNTDASVLLHPISSRRASEAIYDQIRELIISGQLKPGDRLPSERNMMDTLKRSRPTIREALRMLEREGFIRTTAGSTGAVVQELGTDNLRQSLETMLQVREISSAELGEYHNLNELYRALWAAQRRTEADLERIRNSLEVSEQLIDDRIKFVDSIITFHSGMAQASHNDVAWIIDTVLSELVTKHVRNIIESLSYEEYRTLSRKIQEKHYAEFEAVKSQDLSEVRNVMRIQLIQF